MSKILNVCIVYDLDGWPRNSSNSFEFKNCLFGAINIGKDRDKEKYVYCRNVQIFDSVDSWSDFARNVKYFGADK